MARKGTLTTTTYLEWEKAVYLVRQLERSKEKRFALLIGIGIYTGLRISDILHLKWTDLEEAQMNLKERKTNKLRVITQNKQLAELIVRTKTKIKRGNAEYIFINRYGTKPICVQYVNTQLKRILKENKSGLKNVSSHFLRKTFGRRVWDMNDRSEESLVKLSEIFNHSTTAITKRYLGIRSEEIADVYLSL